MLAFASNALKCIQKLIVGDNIQREVRPQKRQRTYESYSDFEENFGACNKKFKSDDENVKYPVSSQRNGLNGSEIDRISSGMSESVPSGTSRKERKQMKPARGRGRETHHEKKQVKFNWNRTEKGNSMSLPVHNDWFGRYRSNPNSEATNVDCRSKNFSTEKCCVYSKIFNKDKANIMHRKKKFTLQETIALEEKDAYRNLLQQFTDAYLPTDTSCSQLSKSTFIEADTRNETLLGSFIKPPEISVPRPAVMRQRVEVKERSPAERNPAEVSLLQDSFVPRPRILGYSRIHTPTQPDFSFTGDTPIITKVRFPEQTVRQTVRKTRPVNDLLQSQYLSEDWINNLKEKYDSRARKTSREIEEVEIKLKILKERREAHDSSIEQRIQERMRISEKEIGVIDDKYVSFDDEEEEEEEEELPELSDSMEMEVDDALISHPSTQILVEGFRLSITRGDLQTLNGLNWLNDEVINFYMNLLMERGQKQGYLKVHAFNTFFYPKLISGGHSALRRWTRKIDLFSMDLILVPVHLGMHWCLAVINFCTKTIAYYDSMGGENKQCLNSLREYLCAEHRDKKKSEFSSIKEWKLEVQQDIPPQMNGSDCGMFTCKYAEYITRGSKITFTQAHMPYFRRRMVWEIIHKQLLQ